VAAAIGLNVEQIRQPGKQPERVRARSALCYLAVIKLGATTVALARELGISQPAVSKAVVRGREHAADIGLRIDTKL
jgi:hypothetical protein